MTEKNIPKFVKLKHPDTGDICFYPFSCNQKHFDDALRYEAKPTNVFVCAYLKCGTTWTQNIVWLILHGGESIPGNMRQSIPMLELDGSDFVNSIDDSVHPRIIKTHLPLKFVPQHREAKYIYVARNPKDAMVSYYYHTKGFRDVYDCCDVNFDGLFDLYIQGEIEFGSHFSHMTDWYKLRDNPNVLFMLYENIKKDTKNAVLQIARFLGKKYEDVLLADGGKKLNEVLEKSSFKKMQSEPDKWVSSCRKSTLGESDFGFVFFVICQTCCQCSCNEISSKNKRSQTCTRFLTILKRGARKLTLSTTSVMQIGCTILC